MGSKNSVDDGKTCACVNTRKKIVGANADPAWQVLELIDRVRLPDVEDAKQDESGENERPRNAERNKEKRDELADDFIDDCLRRVFVAKQFARSSRRPEASQAKQEKYCCVSGKNYGRDLSDRVSGRNQ